MKKGTDAYRAYMRNYMRARRNGATHIMPRSYNTDWDSFLVEPWSRYHARKKAEREATKREANGAVDRGTD